jgi:ElaB/YqjD/DUF883 family membrane-anchored ribosome-binding protein
MRDIEKITRNLDKLAGELKTTLNDAEELLKASGKPIGGALREARAGFVSSLKSARKEAIELQRETIGKVKDAAHSSDKYVRNHPWNVAGAGVCAGLLVGWLISRGNHGAGSSAR